MCASAPQLSALNPQQVEPHIQSSYISFTPLPLVLAFLFKQDVPLLQPLSTYDPLPPLSVSLQGGGEPPLLPSTVRTYVPLLSALLIRQGVPLCKP